VYQHGVLTHDVVIQRRARADLQAVLPDLSRWRYRGRLYAEARLELGRLCRLLGDKPAADRLLRALADDAAIPAARRAEARAILEE
jgi:hypothetical protein